MLLEFMKSHSFKKLFESFTSKILENKMPFIPGAFLAAGFFAALALGMFAADMSFDSEIRNNEC